MSSRNRTKNFFFEWQAIQFALSFLTILPIGKKIIRDDEINQVGYRSVSWFPLGGVVVWGGAGAVAFVSTHILGEMVGAVSACMALLFGTRSLHFDGFCDVLDGFGVSGSVADRLAVMKDSRVGSFALGGAIVLLFLKTSLLYELLTRGWWKVRMTEFILIGIFSRLTPGLLAAFGTYPRLQGTGKFIIGVVSPWRVIVSFSFWTLVGGGIAVFGSLPWVVSLGMAAFVGGIFGILRWWSNEKIGGVTGDVLGFSVEVTEVLLLILSVVLLRGML